MKKFIYVLMPLLVGLTLNSSAQKTFKNSFRTNPVVADGKLNDWGYAIEDENVDKTGRVKYAIANDKENLYIAIRVFDKTTQAKMFLGGMKFYLDSTAQKNQLAVIEFPLIKKAQPGEKPKWDFKPGERLGVKDLHIKAKENNKEMILTGFYPFANGKQTISNNQSGVSIGFDWDEDDAFIYEMVIPFKSFFSTAFLKAVKKNKHELGIGIRVEGIDKNILPERNVYAMMNGGQGHGRTGSGSVNGFGGSGLPNPAEDEVAIYTEPIKYDLKLVLAK